MILSFFLDNSSAFFSCVFLIFWFNASQSKTTKFSLPLACQSEGDNLWHRMSSKMGLWISQHQNTSIFSVFLILIRFLTQANFGQNRCSIQILVNQKLRKNIDFFPIFPRCDSFLIPITKSRYNIYLEAKLRYHGNVQVRKSIKLRASAILFVKYDHRRANSRSLAFVRSRCFVLWASVHKVCLWSDAVQVKG